MREYKTDDNILVFKTDMDAGHGGASGRFKSLEEKALEMAFFIALSYPVNDCYKKASVITEAFYFLK